MIVYLITNKINGRQYVGQTTKSLDARWKQHVRDAFRDPYLVVRKAIVKHGPDNFEVETIHTCLTKEEMDFSEMFYIALLNTIGPNGYNMTYGGESGGAFTGHSHTEEFKAWLRDRFSGTGNANFGKPKSEETKRKMSESQKGKKSFWFGKKTFPVGSTWKGKKQSPEHIANRVKSRKDNALIRGAWHGAGQ